MRRSTLDVLIDPVTAEPLRLEEGELGADNAVVAGVLRSGNRRYPVTAGIPRLVAPLDDAQTQTAESFGYKWGRRDSYESPEMADVARKWLLARYGFSDVGAMQAHFAPAGKLLDAGCGSGFSAGLWTHGWADPPEWVGLDVSTAVDVARERLAELKGADFVQADVLRLPFPDETFDVVFAEGVLHHTPSTWAALASVVRVLKRGGEACFYIYRRKAPLREYADDLVRERIAHLEPKEAWALLRPLTLLARSLAELETEVEVAEGVDVLGIPAGRYDVQRLIYWHFAKLYWNDKLTIDENVHVNFDWYHPRYAHRHTEAEVREECDRAGLDIAHFDAQESGYTVRAVKR